MIYRAAPIQTYRVGVNTAEDHFVPTNGFDTRISDLHVLSHFNEDQSMMHQYSGRDYSSSSQATKVPPARFFTPFTEQTTTVEQQGTPSVALASPHSSHDSPYMPSDMSAGGFSTATKAYDISPLEAGYYSFNGALPASISIFHPPMLVPSQHCPSPLGISPISSVSPSPRKQELQIRMSQPCYEMGQRRHEILPLETNPFKK
jgi:hypothetical protein